METVSLLYIIVEYRRLYIVLDSSCSAMLCLSLRDCPVPELNFAEPFLSDYRGLLPSVQWFDLFESLQWLAMPTVV